MPIIEQIPIEIALSQGDILDGIRLFSTARCWEAGGEAALGKEKLCLVASRPCVAAHKSQITVVAVVPYVGNVPGEVKTFDDIKRFLKDTRDGADSPDVFYIGPLPTKQGRFAARLDAFHTVEIPSKPAERLKFIQSSRIGRLQVDFARDLHLRIFRAFASLGFDDVGWLSDDDLQWLLEKGEAEEAEARKSVKDTAAAMSQKMFSGQPASAGASVGPQKKLDEITDALAPYRAELERRRAEPQHVQGQ